MLLVKLCICISVLFSQLYPLSVDEQLSLGNIQLAKIDSGRIAQQQARWAEYFAQQKSKRKMMWGGVALAAVGALGVIAYAWHKSDEQPAQGNKPAMSNEEFNAARWKAYRDERCLPNGLAEIPSWLAKNTKEAFFGALAFGIGSFFVSKMNSSWEAAKNKFNAMMGFDEPELFVTQAEKVFSDTTRLYSSFDLFVHEAVKLRMDDDLHQKLRLSMARNVIINNLDFVYSIEVCVAFIVQALIQADDIADHHRVEMEQTLEGLCQLINTMIERAELVMQDLCVKNDSSASASLGSVLKGVYGEFKHVVQIAGIVLYGEN